MKEVSRLNNIKYAIVYLDLDPDYAKLNNLPVKLPLLAEDFQKARATNKIPLEYILRGLEAEVEVNKIINIIYHTLFITIMRLLRSVYMKKIMKWLKHI